MPNNNHYNKKLKGFAKTLRIHSTRSEIRLWSEVLRNKQILGYAFLRQRPIGNFIADFMQKDLKFVIELDGITHFDEEGVQKDALKDKALKDLGFTVIRFKDEDVMKQLESVKMKIEDVIKVLEKKV